MNQFNCFKDIFQIDLANQLEQFVREAPYSYSGRSRQDTGFPHWRYSIAPGDESNGLDISVHLPPLIKQAWDQLQLKLGSQTLLRCYINAHTFGVEGYPHRDSFRDYDKTLVVYLNREWSRDWGGETMIYSEDSIVHAELPKFNHALLFSGKDLHCARSVTRACPDLRLTLMFKFAPPGIDVLRDKLQAFINHIGCDRIAHSERRLSTHLLNVYDILKSNGHDDVVCTAGALHGIMGTSKIPSEIVSREHRDIVAKISGYPALELVELYRDIERPDALELAIKNSSRIVLTRSGQHIELTPFQINSLCAIDAANLRDQKLLDRWPHIKQFDKKITGK